VSYDDKVIPTTKLRQAIGRRLVESKATIPHFYVAHEYKMDALMSVRKQANAFLPDNEKISVNDFILKAVALTLRQFPNLNATLKGTEVIQFGHVNVGVAVTVPGGLMTVVVKVERYAAHQRRPCSMPSSVRSQHLQRRRPGRQVTFF
jgi:pyruvate dehydrogenase E2 component (dihydrolipoamide acetyltransferase)